MRFEPSDSVDEYDSDGLLFGDGADYGEDDPDFGDDDPGAPYDPYDQDTPYDQDGQYGPDGQYRPQSRRQAGSGRRRAATRRRRRFFATTAALLVIAVVVALGWVVGRPFIERQLAAKDWSGPGTGQVLVQVKPNDTSADIGATLVADGVVASKRAFTDAADANSASRSVQPGFYRLRKHMAAKLALALLLDPTTRVSTKVTIPEGLIEQDVLARLAKALNVPVSKVQAPAADVADLGLPEGYMTGAKPPPTAEGFLFPDTYSFDPSTTPADALQQMTSEFTGVDRQMGFADAAHKMGLTPYQALIVASMVEGEAKFDADRAKVARVIYNRLKANMPLGIDATSVYGARIAGQDPATINYNKPAPYNTRLTKGLPPTPIGNPGRAAMAAAVQPAPGPWLYYVNGDAAGHLYFTSSPTAFQAAVQKCRANHWGCT